jgi:hypothetical protein
MKTALEVTSWSIPSEGQPDVSQIKCLFDEPVIPKNGLFLTFGEDGLLDMK